MSLVTSAHHILHDPGTSVGHPYRHATVPRRATGRRRRPLDRDAGVAPLRMTTASLPPSESDNACGLLNLPMSRLCRGRRGSS